MSISFGNLTTNNSQINPELQKRIESQENFTAIDTEKLKQDTVEIASKAGEQVKDNFVFRILKNLGVEDPKKFLKSVAYTTIAIAGVAIFGNKMSNKFADLGLKCDELLQRDGFKWARNIGEGIKKGKNNVVGSLKNSKTINNVISTLSNSTKKLRALNPWAKSQCAGPKFQFSCAVIESMQGIFYGKTKKIAEKFAKDIQIDGVNIGAGKLDKEFIRKMILSSGDEFNDFKAKISGEKATDFINEITEAKNSSESLLKKLIGDKENVHLKALKTIIEDNADDRVQFADEFSENIRKLHGTNGAPATNKELLEFFKEIQRGKGDFKDCANIEMIHGMDNWAFTNWIDKIYSKIFPNKHISRANLGSTLIKYNAVSGKLADSTMGKFVQGFPTIFSESVSNHVCDMAAINMVVVPSFISLFNNVQDAPKEQKVATLTNNFITDVGHITVVIPAAAGLTYGLASLSKIDSKASLLSKPLTAIGKVFALGLDKTANDAAKQLKWFSKDFFKKLGNSTARWGGGAFRLAMIMFVFSGMISKPIEKLVQKIFGKPYNKEEAEKERQLEEQKKQIIPELGITQGELMEKMQKNPAAMQRLQADPKLAYTIEQNPKAILDLLDGKEIQYIEPTPTPASQGVILSPANKNRINNKINMTPTSETKMNSTNVAEKQQETIVDNASYIPSSEFVAPKSTMSVQQQSEYDAMMIKADKYLKAAEKYI